MEKNKDIDEEIRLAKAEASAKKLARDHKAFSVMCHDYSMEELALMIKGLLFFHTQTPKEAAASFVAHFNHFMEPDIPFPVGDKQEDD